MQEKETKAMYRLVLHNTVSKLSKGQTDLKRKYLINITKITKSKHQKHHQTINITKITKIYHQISADFMFWFFPTIWMADELPMKEKRNSTPVGNENGTLELRE